MHKLFIVIEKQFLQSLVVCRLFLLKGIYSVAVILHLPSMLLFSLIYHSELGRGRKFLSKNGKSYIMHCVGFVTISQVPLLFEQKNQ